MGNCCGKQDVESLSKPQVLPHARSLPRSKGHGVQGEGYTVPLVERAVHPFFLSALCTLEVTVNGKTKKLGDMRTGAVVSHFVKPETAGKYGSLVNCVAAIVGGLWDTHPIPSSLITLAERYRQAAGGPKPFHGPSTFFVSHAWSYKLSELRQMVVQHYEGVCGSELKWFPLFYWVDIAAVNQNFAGDFSTNPDGNFPSVIRECRGVVFTVHPWTRPVAPRRIWCLFEALTAVELGVELELVLDPEFRRQAAPLEELEATFRGQVVGRLNVGKAQASVEEDRRYILSLLEKRPGGVKAFNSMMQDMLSRRMLEVLLMRAVIGQNVEGGKKMVALGARISRKVLKFKFARVTDTSLEILCPALHGNDTLHTLDLTSPGDKGLITHRGVTYLVAALMRNTSLQELVLSNNPMIGELGVAEISEEVLRSPGCALTRLHLRRTGMDNDAMRALAGALAANTSLQHLDVSLNDDVQDDGVIALLQAVRDNRSLFSLAMSYLPLDSRRVWRELAAMVEANNALEALTVSHCSLGSEAVERLAQALSRNMTLKCLDVSDNRFGDEGCAALAGALESNLFLEELRMTGCDVGEEGARVLRDALAKNKSLQHVALAGNKVTVAQWEALTRRAGGVNAQVDFIPQAAVSGVSSSTLAATGRGARDLGATGASSAFLGSFVTASSTTMAVGTSFAAVFGSQSYPLMMSAATLTPRAGSSAAGMDAQASDPSGPAAARAAATSATGIQVKLSAAGAANTNKSAAQSAATSRQPSTPGSPIKNGGGAATGVVARVGTVPGGAGAQVAGGQAGAVPVVAGGAASRFKPPRPP